MSMPRLALDHLVVAAETLDAGQAWIRDHLGVDVPRGGAHDHMATHNCVGRIGEDIYLEIIAVNPDDTPDRVRWFAMDDPTVKDRLTRDRSFLYHWVVNSSDIMATLASATHDPGPAMAMSRGALNWKISVRDDGALARGGLIPTIIEWPDVPHPSRGMADLDICLERLTLQTPDTIGTTAILEAFGAADFCEISDGPENRITAAFTVNGETRTL